MPAYADVSGGDAVADGYAVADAAAVGVVSPLILITAGRRYSVMKKKSAPQQAEGEQI